MSPHTPILVAHRKNAADQFVDAAHANWFECDIRSTADGVPVLLHDERLAGLPDNRAEVWRHNFSELDDVNTFARALEMAKLVEPRIGVMAEIKPEDARLVESVINLLRQHAGPWKILSFMPTNLLHARSIDPAIECVFLAESRQQFERALADRWAAVYAEHSLLKKETVAQLRANGAAQIGAWTVNDPIDVWRVDQLGVDVIITDSPRMAANVLTRTRDRAAAARDNPPKIG